MLVPTWPDVGAQKDAKRIPRRPQNGFKKKPKIEATKKVGKWILYFSMNLGLKPILLDLEKLFLPSDDGNSRE